MPNFEQPWDALAEAVELARAAQAAGLIVTRIQPTRCTDPETVPCYKMQLWQPDARLWAEGSRESVDFVRGCIESYAGRINGYSQPPTDNI